MIGKFSIRAAAIVILGFAVATAGSDLDDRIRAAGADIRVFCPAVAAEDIQWPALLYLNQAFGAEIYVALLQSSPTYASKVSNTDDGQFHLAEIGYGSGFDGAAVADSMFACLFDSILPDIVIFGAGSVDDSVLIETLLAGLWENPQADSSAAISSPVVFVRGSGTAPADAVINDNELMKLYATRAEALAKHYPLTGPQVYNPEQYAWYYRVDKITDSRAGGFLADLQPFRLPGMAAERLPDGPERKHILESLQSYMTSVKAAAQAWRERPERLSLLLDGLKEAQSLVERVHSGIGWLADSELRHRIAALNRKAFLAATEALGIDWTGHLETRDTPFGPASKLTLDLTVTGPRTIELAYFKFHPHDRDAVIVDSIFQDIQPHQRFYRKYPVDLDDIDVTDETGDSLLFSVEVIVDRTAFNLYLPYRGFADEEVGLAFLPGYAFLSPFTSDEFTALAQPFDWQLRVTKPYASELSGKIIIDNPDGIVVGSYDENIFMPKGITSKYIDIHLAAGRSIKYDLRTVRAYLTVGGQRVAETGADVRVIRCNIPETRDIAFIPDPEGRLEDFLRLARASFQPFTPHSLIRAQLDAYDVIVIGSNADEYYDVLRATRDRLREFVRNGGEIVIFGQGFGWPHDLFEFSIYPAEKIGGKTIDVSGPSHTLMNDPYAINGGNLIAGVKPEYERYPAVIGGGTEIVSAGELGSHIKVVKVGEGYIVYCGLPLLEMTADLDVEAIHLLANIVNLGHENR